MAVRLLSDGVVGFVGDQIYQYYGIAPREQSSAVKAALRIVREYVFVGLQSERFASTCRLQKTVDHFKIPLGPTEERVAPSSENSDSYKLEAEKIWGQFTTEGQDLFREMKKSTSPYTLKAKNFSNNMRSYLVVADLSDKNV